MAFGIATSRESWKLARQAEEPRFSPARFYDTRTVAADRVAAAAALATASSGHRRIAPSSRNPAATARAFATMPFEAPAIDDRAWIKKAFN